MKLRVLLPLLGFSLVLVLIFIAETMRPSDTGMNTGPNPSEWPSMKACVTDALQRAGEKASPQALWTANEICYSHLHGQGLLNDFKIRRLKFTQQAYDERILLWMVVTITLSGVALAGVQLLASYHLAIQGKGTLDQQNELSVERGKLSLKSSITGLLILVCSFAFFWVFVYEIYVIHTLGDDGKREGKKATTETTAPNEQIGFGLIQPAAGAASAAAPASAAR
jgi:hypothetical protein